MKAKLKRYALHYAFGLFATAWNGGVGAIDAFLGIAAGAAVSPSISEPNWRMALAVFATAFLRNALLYFQQHPLPTDPDELLAQHTAAPSAAAAPQLPPESVHD